MDGWRRNRVDGIGVVRVWLRGMRGLEWTEGMHVEVVKDVEGTEVGTNGARKAVAVGCILQGWRVETGGGGGQNGCCAASGPVGIVKWGDQALYGVDQYIVQCTCRCVQEYSVTRLLNTGDRAPTNACSERRGGGERRD